jgi:hypothetical protein
MFSIPNSPPPHLSKKKFNLRELSGSQRSKYSLMGYSTVAEN